MIAFNKGSDRRIESGRRPDSEVSPAEVSSAKRRDWYSGFSAIARRSAVSTVEVVSKYCQPTPPNDQIQKYTPDPAMIINLEFAAKSGKVKIFFSAPSSK